MKRTPHRTAALLMGLAVLLSACVTVNIYFPAAKVQRTADQIVDEVYKGQGGEAGKGDSSWLRLLEFIGPRPAHAADATTVSNASIRALKDQIAQRHASLKPHYDAGRVGIGKDGMLVVRGADGLDVRQVAQLRRLVAADNDARQKLYQEVAAALGQPDQVAKVRSIFAQAWRDKAQGGWWVQGDNGAWRKK